VTNQDSYSKKVELRHGRYPFATSLVNYSWKSRESLDKAASLYRDIYQTIPDEYMNCLIQGSSYTARFIENRDS
jgi:hypothetical protein